MLEFDDIQRILQYENVFSHQSYTINYSPSKIFIEIRCFKNPIVILNNTKRRTFSREQANETVFIVLHC